MPEVPQDELDRGAARSAAAEDRERAAERHRAPLLDNTPLAVVEWDRELRVAGWWGRADAIFGWTAEQARDRGIDELRVVHEDAARFRDAVARLRDGVAGAVLEARGRTRSGEPRTCEWHLSALRDERGELAGVLGLGLDVSERVRAETLRRETARRSDEFLGALAHELRNPLAPIRNALEIMRLAGHDSGAAERARALIERQLAEVVRTIDDLLDVSRLSLGRLELAKERLEVGSLLRDAVAASRPLLDAAFHTLEVETLPSPAYVEGDRERLVQVIATLLGNASRCTEPRGAIRLSARLQDGAVAIAVHDEGIGIPPEALPHVFSMLGQDSRDPDSARDGAEAARSRHRAASGLGVGLTLVRQLVERHGGRVEARSDGPGRGSELEVRLPTVAAPAPLPPEKASARVAALGPRRRILVVDDNVDAATSLATMLRMMGHETLTAHDGLSALEAAATRRPQVVLLDIGMPGMSGYEVATRIRGSEWGRGMGLVALTGWGQEEDRKRSQEAGFDEHLVKPVHPEMLAGVLAALPRPGVAG